MKPCLSYESSLQYTEREIDLPESELVCPSDHDTDPMVDLILESVKEVSQPLVLPPLSQVPRELPNQTLPRRIERGVVELRLWQLVSEQVLLLFLRP